MIPVAVMGVIALSIVAMALVFIADILWRASIAAAEFQQRRAIASRTPDWLVEAVEFRLTWIAGLVGVVGPAVAAFVASAIPRCLRTHPSFQSRCCESSA